MVSENKLCRRNFLAGMTALGGVAILAACAPNPTPTPKPAPEEEEEEVTKEEPTVAPAEDAVELTFLCAGTSEVESKHQTHWTEEFNKEHENIHVNIELIAWGDLLTKERSYIAAGDPYDVAWYCGATAKERWLMGWAEPLEQFEVLAETKDRFKDSLFAPESPNIVEEDGEQHWLGLPFCNFVSGVIARRDIVEEKTDLSGKEEIRQHMETHDGFEEVANAIHDPDDLYAISGDLMMWAGQLVPGNGLLSIADFSPDWEDEYVEALECAAELFKLMPADAPAWEPRDWKASYANSTVGLIREGTYFYGDIVVREPELMTPEASVIVPVPRGSGVDDNILLSGFCGYYMCAESEHKEETAEFMAFLAQPEVENSFPMNLSPLKVTAEERMEPLNELFPDLYGERAMWWFEQWNTMQNTYQSGFAEAVVPNEEINDIVERQMVRLFNEEITPEEAYEAVKPKVEEVCKVCPRRDGREFEEE